MILALKDFGRKSGMEVNATKSEGFTASSTNHVHKGSVEISDIKFTWDVGSYLHVPLYSGRVMTHEEASSANISMRVRKGFLGGRLEPLLLVIQLLTFLLLSCKLVGSF
jgi:hypothetical protein